MEDEEKAARDRLPHRAAAAHEDLWDFERFGWDRVEIETNEGACAVCLAAAGRPYLIDEAPAIPIDRCTRLACRCDYTSVDQVAGGPHCCAVMAERAEFICPEVNEVHRGDPLQCPDRIVVRRFNGAYGLLVHDGGTASVAISHFPWCGAGLPVDPRSFD